MFKFDFGAGSRAAEAEAVQPAADTCQAAAAAAEEVPHAEGAELPGSRELVAVSPHVTLVKGTMPTAAAAALLGQHDVAASDLLPGTYEGGFKLWEGGMDLATFWAGLAAAAAAGEMERLRVVELGCGHGLPGVVALLAGSSVHFQDYNKEVLQVLTVPTVAANWAAHCARGGAAPLPAPAPRARYFSGDWSSYAQLLDALDLQGTYDVVLSAETIYNLAGMRSLYLCIKQCLSRPSGVAYIASKSYYFGVGGGVSAFLAMVQADGAMRGEVAKTINDGLSTTREIVKLQWV